MTGRRLLTIDVNVEPPDTEPTLAVLRAITEREDEAKDAIVRLQVSLSAEGEAHLRDSEIRNALKDAHYFTITPPLLEATCI